MTTGTSNCSLAAPFEHGSRRRWWDHDQTMDSHGIATPSGHWETSSNTYNYDCNNRKPSTNWHLGDHKKHSYHHRHQQHNQNPIGHTRVHHPTHPPHQHLLQSPVSDSNTACLFGRRPSSHTGSLLHDDGYVVIHQERKVSTLEKYCSINSSTIISSMNPSGDGKGVNGRMPSGMAGNSKNLTTPHALQGQDHRHCQHQLNQHNRRCPQPFTKPRAFPLVLEPETSTTAFDARLPTGRRNETKTADNQSPCVKASPPFASVASGAISIQKQDSTLRKLPTTTNDTCVFSAATSTATTATNTTESIWWGQPPASSSLSVLSTDKVRSTSASLSAHERMMMEKDRARRDRSLSQSEHFHIIPRLPPRRQTPISRSKSTEEFDPDVTTSNHIANSNHAPISYTRLAVTTRATLPEGSTKTCSAHEEMMRSKERARNLGHSSDHVRLIPREVRPRANRRLTGGGGVAGGIVGPTNSNELSATTILSTSSLNVNHPNVQHDLQATTSRPHWSNQDLGQGATQSHGNPRLAQERHPSGAHCRNVIKTTLSDHERMMQEKQMARASSETVHRTTRRQTPERKRPGALEVRHEATSEKVTQRISAKPSQLWSRDDHRPSNTSHVIEHGNSSWVDGGNSSITISHHEQHSMHTNTTKEARSFTITSEQNRLPKDSMPFGSTCIPMREDQDDGIQYERRSQSSSAIGTHDDSQSRDPRLIRNAESSSLSEVIQGNVRGRSSDAVSYRVDNLSTVLRPIAVRGSQTNHANIWKKEPRQSPETSLTSNSSDDDGCFIHGQTGPHRATSTSSSSTSSSSNSSESFEGERHNNTRICQVQATDSPEDTGNGDFVQGIVSHGTQSRVKTLDLGAPKQPTQDQEEHFKRESRAGGSAPGGIRLRQPLIGVGIPVDAEIESSDKKAHDKRSKGTTINTIPKRAALFDGLEKKLPDSGIEEIILIEHDSGPSLARAISGEIYPGAFDIVARDELRKPYSNREVSKSMDSEGSSPSKTAFHAVQTSDVVTEVQGQIHAQAGIPVVFPGAFAVQGMDSSTNPGRQSPGNVSASTIDENCTDSDDELESGFFESTVPPLEAILAEDAVVVDGAVVDDTEDGGNMDPKTAKYLRWMHMGILFSSVAAIMLVTFSVLSGFSKSEGSIESSTTPLIEGWRQVGSDIFGSIDEPRTFFGFSLALSAGGDRVVVAAPGADAGFSINVGNVYVFQQVTKTERTAWQAVEKSLRGPGPTDVPDVSITSARDAQRFAVGYPRYANGHVEVYEESAVGYSAQQLLLNPDDESGESWFGYSLDMSEDGKTLAVGSPRSTTAVGSQSGMVRIFHEKDGIWSPMGAAITGELPEEFFGWSVALSSNFRVAIGAPLSNAFRGTVRIFEWNGSTWQQIGQTLEGASALNRYGESLDISNNGKIVAVGARGTLFETPGYSRVFNEVDGGWVQLGASINGEENGEAFGAAVALSGDGLTVAVGAPLSSRNGDQSGKIKVFRYNHDIRSWASQGSDIFGSVGSEFGSSVRLSEDGNLVVGGAPSMAFDGRVAGAGCVRVFEREQ